MTSPHQRVLIAVACLLLTITVLTTPAAQAASATTAITTAPRAAGSANSGGDAAGLRLGLLTLLALALVGGFIMQYQTIMTPHDGQAMGSPTPSTHGHRRPDTPATWDLPEYRRPTGGWEHDRELALAVSAFSTGSMADEYCARAVEAALSYDRAGTVAAFAAAVSCDPTVKPSATTGFWEMPSGGHADLARAYLRHDRPLEARSVLTVASMLFGPHRELEALRQESDAATARRRGWE